MDYNNVFKKVFRFVSSVFIVFFLFAVVASGIIASTYGGGKYGSGVYSPTGTSSSGSTSTSSNNSNNSQSSTTNPPSCDAQTPGDKVPWLYAAIAQDSQSIMLYFTPADDPVNHYVLEYGTSSGDYKYGVSDLGIVFHHQMTYLVQSLVPSTTYYFRIRGGNGCATGGWSNELSTKTKGIVTLNNLDLTSSELTPVATPTPKSKTSQTNQTYDTYDLKVLVLNENQKPVKDAEVTIHSKVQTAKTNENGIAIFKEVEKGNHQILIAYGNYKGEESVNLTGNVKEFDLNVHVKKENILISPIYIGTVIIFLIIIAGLLIYLKKRKK